MASFDVTIRGRAVERIEAADAYQQEGPMTTFFRSPPGRQVIDSWSVRIASFPTAEIMAIRRHEAAVVLDALLSA